MLEPGAEFAGFRIVGPIGRGGMGEVYLVEHPRLPRREALKVLAESYTADDEYRQRFIREADLAAKLWHPNLVSLHDRGEADGRLWISMDYIDGSDTGEMLRSHSPDGLPPTEVAEIISAVAAALDYAHQSGMLHRDVKPTNILCSAAGAGERRIVLADFGIAREITDSSRLTATDTALGTVAYAAPEQLMGKTIDGRSDQYALAATAFHLLTGSPPFNDSNPVSVISQHLTAIPPKVGELRPDLAALDSVFATALSKEPDQRYPTCSDFARDLARRLDPLSDTAGFDAAFAPTQQAPIAVAARRSRRTWVAALAAAALIAGVIFALSAGQDRKKAETAQSPSSPAVAVPAGAGEASIEAVGFGRPVASSYLWLSAIVRGAKSGELVVVSFNLLGADGTIVVTESQTEEAVNPDSRMIIGKQITLPRNKEVARVEASIAIRTLDGTKPKLENVILEVSDYSIGVDAQGIPTAEAIIRNPSEQKVPNARVGIACFDPAGKIIGGGASFPDLIPPGGRIKISQSVLVSARPARCEMTAQPSDF